MDTFDRRRFIKFLAVNSALLSSGAVGQLGCGSRFTKKEICDMVIGKDLPPRYPRRIVPENLDLGNLNLLDLFPLFEDLYRRKLDTVSAIEEWLLDASALLAALSEEGVRRYITMTCHTDNKACEKQHLHFANRLEPLAGLFSYPLLKKFIKAPARKSLPQSRYFVLNRTADNTAELFSVKNILLWPQQEKIKVQYQKITAAMTVTFQNREYTIEQMAKFLDQNDRSVRQAAWESMYKRWLQDRGALDDILNRLIKLRIKEAKNAGFDNYRDYIFRAKGRFDYGVKECLQFHEAAEKLAVPLSRRIQERRGEKLGLEKLRPWDLDVDAEGRPPLRPFETVEQLVAGCVKILSQIHPDFGQTLSFMHEHQLLDLESRKGKAHGGYRYDLAEYRLPFIFMNATGIQYDVSTLVHESGHAIHTMEYREEPLFSYRFDIGSEMTELASLSMQIMGRDYYEVFYSPEDANRVRIKNMEDDIFSFCVDAFWDAFQHWLYTHPGHSVTEREEAWLELHQRFGNIADYSGYEDVLKTSWHRIGGIYLSPFYIIEYGISKLAAYQVWQAVRKNHQEGIKALRRGLALGGSKPLPELYAACGVKFDFSENTLKPIIEDLARQVGL